MPHSGTPLGRVRLLLVEDSELDAELLIEQLLEYADGSAVDPFLAKGKAAPSELNQDDRIFLLENFFSANRQNMIEPSRRYLELLYMAGEGKPGTKAMPPRGKAQGAFRRDVDAVGLELVDQLREAGACEKFQLQAGIGAKVKAPEARPSIRYLYWL